MSRDADDARWEIDVRTVVADDGLVDLRVRRICRAGAPITGNLRAIRRVHSQCPIRYAVATVCSGIGLGLKPFHAQ